MDSRSAHDDAVPLVVTCLADVPIGSEIGEWLLLGYSPGEAALINKGAREERDEIVKWLRETAAEDSRLSQSLGISDVLHVVADFIGRRKGSGPVKDQA